MVYLCDNFFSFILAKKYGHGLKFKEISRDEAREWATKESAPVIIGSPEIWRDLLGGRSLSVWQGTAKIKRGDVMIVAQHSRFWKVLTIPEPMGR